MASKAVKRKQSKIGLSSQSPPATKVGETNTATTCDEEQQVTSTNKDELITKRHNLCFGTKLQPEWESRSLKINPVHSDDIQRFVGNEQHLHKWTLARFVLRVVRINIRRLPYIWGVLLFVINLVTHSLLLRKGSPKLPWYSNGAVLFTSLFISLLTNALGSVKRYFFGRCLDFKKYHILQARKARLNTVRSCDLVVGNILKLTCDEDVPADMILLACSNPDGQVHIETSQIDGNQDLKVKFCAKDTRLEASIHSFANIRGQVTCDRPSSDTENFNGTIRLRGHPRARNVHIDNFVMKGSIIRNTGAVYGVITHTGPDTKVAQNIGRGKHTCKLSSMEGIINHFTVVIACIYLLCLFVSTGTRWSVLLVSDRRKRGTATVIESLLFVMTRFILIYGGLIPITLPAIVDLVRYAFSTNFDGHMDYSFLNDDSASKDQDFPDPTAPDPLVPTSWPMSPGFFEELGMVDIIFCDKTGTLTCNDLTMTHLVVGDRIFNIKDDRAKLHYEFEKGGSRNDQLDKLLKLMTLCNASTAVTSPHNLDTFASPSRMATFSSQPCKPYVSRNSDLACSNPSSINYPLRPSKSKIHFGNVSYIEPMASVDFGLKELDLSHNSIDLGSETVDNDPDESFMSSSYHSRSSRSSNTLYYRSPFKEDECMMDMANDFGYKLAHRSAKQIQMEVFDVMETWDIIGFNSFSSKRRRMSIVLRKQNQKGSDVFVKGSGETMVTLLRSSTEEQRSEISKLSKSIQKLTSAGLRVIVCAHRVLSREETQAYQRNFSDAVNSVYSAETLHEEAAFMVEKDLTYIGMAVMKDEIQPGVPETLELLMEAGVRVWMTTGDNRHSALEAAYQAKLLVNPCQIFDCKLPEDKTDETLVKYGAALYDLFLQQRGEKASSEQLCLVIDGADLRDFMYNSDMQTYFVNMLCFSDVVVACRLTPFQKAEFVRHVKTRLMPTPVTLAIGDGLNDVRMMNEAHVGVAVLGASADAAAYADFVTSHFAGLRSLMFYQGSSSLQVIAAVTYWSFFKSLCFVMPIFYYQGQTDWVALDLYGSFIHLLFHLIFTTIPVLVCALYGSPLSEPTLTNLPALYTLCRRRFHINLLRIGFWILEGILSSICCYISIQASGMESPMLGSGGTLSARAFGLLCSLGALEMSNTRLFMELFLRNNSLGIAFSLLFLLGMPPIFVGLCFLCGGQALRNGAYQVALWQPVYFLIPVWITTGAVCHALSALTQAVVCPDIGNYLRHWVPSQKCNCSQHTPADSVATNKTQRRSTVAMVHSIFAKMQNPHIWCDRLLKTLRKELGVHGAGALPTLMPAARPFRVREGYLPGIQEFGMTSSSGFSKGNVGNDMRKVYGNVSQENRGSHLIDRLTLHFKDAQLESDYTRDKRRNHYRMNRVWYRSVFLVIGAFYIGSWILDYYLKKAWNLEATKYSFIAPLFVTILCVCCALLTFHPVYFVNHVNKALGTLVISMVLHHIIALRLVKPLSSMQPILFPIFTFVILNVTFIYALLANIVFVIVTVTNVDTSIHTVPLFVGINVFVAFVGYRLEYNTRKNFLFEFTAQIARKKQSELLNTMLPNFVVSKMINARLNEDGIPIGFEAEEHESVSVIFCDVYHFQDLVATVEPTILVEVLDSLFLAFDRCAEQFGATKIETVFETYLAALGLSRDATSSPSESAGNAIDMALAMIEAARQVRYRSRTEKEDGSYIEDHPSLPVKIGINSGRVISGLVGAKKPQYALFGDTVNTASRMKSTGEVGYIHITDSTYNLVKADTTLHFSHRETDVKGKGLMTTHLLIAAGGSAYPTFEVGDSTNAFCTFRTLNSSDELLQSSVSIEPFADSGINVDSKDNNSNPNGSRTLFECLEKEHPLNSTEGGGFQAESSCHISSSMGMLFSNNYERARARKLRISVAVGALTEYDEGDLVRDHLPLLKNHTIYSMRTSSSHSAPIRGSRCISFFRKSNTITHINSLIASSTLQSASFTKQITQMEDDTNDKLDGRDIRMQTREWLQLKFKDKLQEDRYRSHFYHNRAHVSTIEQSLVIFLITFVTQSILEIAIPRSFVDNEMVERFLYLRYVPYWTVRSVYITLLFLMWLMFHFKSFSQRSESNTKMWLTAFLNLIFVSAACIFALSNSWAVSKSGYYSKYLNLWLPSDSIEFYFYIVVLHHSSGMMFQTCLLVDALFILISLTFISSSVVQTATTSLALLSIPSYIAFNLISTHCKESIDRRTFYSNEKARMIEARVGQMLNDMLPKSVLEEFKNDKLKMSYCHEKMSFLFSDIVGFTSWANSVDACDVVALLQKLFARFDRNSTKFGLFKLCSIGDAYVAVSEPATEVPSDQEAMIGIESILQMAYSMIRTIQDVRENFSIPGLNMRIGLHYGNSVGGVIGSGRLRYDLWGTDIQTANAMERYGIPGKICVSETLKLLLIANFQNRFTFAFNNELHVIDRCVRSYILTSDANDNSVF